MTIETAQVAYRDADAALNGFLALDSDRPGPRPGIIVVHGGAGVDGSLETTRPAEPPSIGAHILVCHGALDPHVAMTQVTASPRR